jgi:hypothetical protein
MTNQTKHSSNCTRVFKHYDSSCPRCQELMNGSKPRDGWQKQYYAKKASDNAMREAAIQAHFAPNGPHAKGLCGPVCTAFDW